VARRRRQWRARQASIDPKRLVFIDETWAKTNMAPLRGWGPRGQRLIGKAPHGRWSTLTFLAALRHDRIEAPCLFNGPINGQKFQAYIEQFLIPTLQPGDIVVLDNLASHKGKQVRRAIRRARAKLIFLPPYSPDLNPIEQAFAKLKHWLRQAQARSIEEIYQSLASILQRFQAQECAAYLENSGYAST
jgi:transposase